MPRGGPPGIAKKEKAERAQLSDSPGARPEVDDPRDHELKGIAEINLAKHRNGETGQFQLAWIGGYTKFENLADEDFLTG